jgi:predicted nucleic acid-binding protein
MIADTTFLIQLLQERTAGASGPAGAFFESHRNDRIRTTVISLGEIAVAFPSSAAAWDYFKRWRIYPLHRGIIDAAGDVDKELIVTGRRLGENDNWIAGFCCYYREPIISLDQAFDRVPQIRRLTY